MNIPKHLQKAIKVYKKDNKWYCTFRKHWGLIWPEHHHLIGHYKAGKIRGGTSWTVRCEDTAEKALIEFLCWIENGYLVKDMKDIKKIKIIKV